MKARHALTAVLLTTVATTGVNVATAAPASAHYKMSGDDLLYCGHGTHYHDVTLGYSLRFQRSFDSTYRGVTQHIHVITKDYAPWVSFANFNYTRVC